MDNDNFFSVITKDFFLPFRNLKPISHSIPDSYYRIQCMLQLVQHQTMGKAFIEEVV